MAKSNAPHGVTLTYPATTAYKQWVWKEIRKRSGVARGTGSGALQWLVDEMKRLARKELLEIGKLESLQTGTLSMFLGSEDEVPPPTNSSLIPAINRALGIAPPPVCDPTDGLSQLVDRFRSRWASATPRERAALVALLASNDDESNVE